MINWKYGRDRGWSEWNPLTPFGLWMANTNPPDWQKVYEVLANVNQS